MSEPDLQAAEIIDGLLCLFAIWEGEALPDNQIIRDALRYLSETRRKHPGFGVTISLSGVMRQRGYETESEWSNGPPAATVAKPTE